MITIVFWVIVEHAAVVMQQFQQVLTNKICFIKTIIFGTTESEQYSQLGSEEVERFFQSCKNSCLTLICTLQKWTLNSYVKCNMVMGQAVHCVGALLHHKEWSWSNWTRFDVYKMPACFASLKCHSVKGWLCCRMFCQQSWISNKELSFLALHQDTQKNSTLSSADQHPHAFIAFPHLFNKSR